MAVQIADRMTEDLLADLARVPSLDEDALWVLWGDSAQTFGLYTLTPRLPREQRRGSVSAEAEAIRAQRAEAAASVWLAVETELDRRREAKWLGSVKP